MTHILIPREPNPALLRPFISCPEGQLPEAWAAMVRAAEVQNARAGRSCLAQIQEPAAVAGPAWSKTRDSLAMLLLGLASNPNLSLDVACIALDAATESGMPLAYLRGAPAAPALEAPAAPLPELPGPDLWRDASGLRGYTKDPGQGPWYTAETVRALLAAAPQAPAAPIPPAGCGVHPLSSRGCERGTRGCVVEHQAPAAPDHAKWCSYVAGVICTYLGEADEGPKATAIAKIIERRLWAISAAPAAPAEAQRLADFLQRMRTRLGSCRDACGDEASMQAWDDYERAWTMLLAQAAPAASAVDAPIVWPKARDVGRIGDMSPSAHLRIGLDSDNDVYASIWDEHGGGSIEFCTPGAGGGKSSNTRMALIALMVAMEADNAADPGRDWWALRNGAAQAKEGGEA